MDPHPHAQHLTILKSDPSLEHHENSPMPCRSTHNLQEEQRKRSE